MSNLPGKDKLIDWLKSSNRLYLENAYLADFTTFRLGGPCPVLIKCRSTQDVTETLRFLASMQSEFLLIGSGSNLVVSDAGLPYPVVQFFCDHEDVFLHDNELTVSGATQLDDLAGYCADNGLSELVCCSGIPGTVGGAVTGNAGAFGWQVGDALIRATICTPDGAVKDVEPATLEFSYRDSRLKHCNDVLVSATFKLNFGNPVELQKKREELLLLRSNKHPNWEIDNCAGSVFRNIEATSKADRRQAAGYFLEEAGAKTMSVGGAGIFPKHANIIIKNDPTCTAQDVYDLHLKMRDAVKSKFDLDIFPEIRFIGEFQ